MNFIFFIVSFASEGPLMSTEAMVMSPPFNGSSAHNRDVTTSLCSNICWYVYSSKEVLHHLDFFIFLIDILTNKF